MNIHTVEIVETAMTNAFEVKYPRFQESIPALELCEGRYLLRFAQNAEDLDQVLKLRFEVFNLELGEGLASSYRTGRDRDEYDAVCHHLMIVEAATGDVVGTYRMQTGEMAAAGAGFYSSGEFALDSLPREMLNDSVELGRACIALSHRNTVALYLLWKGIAAYVAYNQKRFLFGCCSLTSQDPEEGVQMFRMLEAGGHIHLRYSVLPHAEFACTVDSANDTQVSAVKIPRLFRTYLRFGARVCGQPAIDRVFKTIDYLVIFDIFEMDRDSHRMFFDAA